MRSGKYSRYKRQKMGDLPGDYPIKDKIHMLEKGTLQFGYYPWIDPAKGFRKQYVKNANARFRQRRHKEIAESLENDNAA